MQRHDQHSDDHNGHQADAEDRTLRLQGRWDGGPEGAAVHEADDEGGDGGRRQRGQRHVRQEGTTREVEMAQDDEVGQVRAGQQ